MRFQAKSGPHLMIVMISLCALANIRLPVRLWSQVGRPPRPMAAEPYLEKVEPLNRLLPEKASLGFVIDTDHMNPEIRHPGARFGLTEYALLPRLVDMSLDHPLVIVDSDDAQAEPAIAVRSGWTLMVDLHNGVRVYRTREGK